MDLKHNIRLVSVIAHANHGKTTLTNSLAQKAGITTANVVAGDGGGALYTHTRRRDKGEHGITIKSTGITMYFEYDGNVNGEISGLTAEEQKCLVASELENEKRLAEAKNNNVQFSEKSYLINLIDSPGHVDFSSEVTAALRVTDGALLVVDTINRVCVQTETVLRQAISERVRPVLMLNKVDRALLESQLPAEELYQAFRCSIESVNVIIATYNDKQLGDVEVNPTKGTVAFGSGLHQWAFTLKIFAKTYGAKFNVPEDKILEKLWGDWYYDASRKVWSTSDKDGTRTLERAFCQLIVTPITTLFEAIMKGKHGKVKKMLKAIGVELKGKEKELAGKKLLKCVMHKWLPAGDTVLEMIILHLPSPVAAQKYRVNTLYGGPLDDTTAQAIRSCDTTESAPLCMYISKMIPSNGDNKGHFYSFGRVFSGKVATGQKVRIMGPNYVPGKKTDLWIKNVQRTVIMMGKHTEEVADVPAGNICALVGVDQYLLKSGTICTEEDAHCIRKIKFSLSPLVRCSIEPNNPIDLPKLIEGMKCLSKSAPTVLCYTEDSGEHIIAASGELQLEICLQDLQEDFMRGAEVKISDPVVSFRETCTTKSSQICYAKSGNRHNKFFAEAEPLGADLCAAIENGDVQVDTEAKILGHYLADNFGWDIAEARKIWAFGPESTGPNLIVNKINGATPPLSEIKPGVVSGFDWATRFGPLCEEQMHGNRFNLLDVFVHSDGIHRGWGQLITTVRRVCYSSMLAGHPTILEPVYLCNISGVPQDSMESVYSILTRCRGHIFAEEQHPGTSMVVLSAYLPIMESFGFTAALRSSTGGKAFPQCSFDHWEPISGSPYEEGSKVNEIINSIRQRKGLPDGVPELSKYLDKL